MTAGCSVFSDFKGKFRFSHAHSEKKGTMPLLTAGDKLLTGLRGG
jgi:hypothetical protein